MTYQQVIDYYKTQTRALDALRGVDGKGVAQSTMSEWQHTGIPTPRQAQFEIATRGKLKADRPYRRAA